MGRTTNKDKALSNYRLWNTAGGTNRAKWEVTAKRAREFYMNDQLTEQEKKDLIKAGMPTFTVNRVTPIINIMKYFVTANNPRWQGVGAEGSDTDIGGVFSDITDYCWNISYGNAVYGQIVQDALCTGTGYFFIEVDPDADHGRGEVFFRSIDPMNVYVDPMSRDLLFRDAGFIIVHKRFTKEQLILKLPEYAKKIRRATTANAYDAVASSRDVDTSDIVEPNEIGYTYTEDSDISNPVDYFECYTKVKVPFYSVFYVQGPSANELMQIKQRVEVMVKEFTNEIEVKLAEQLKAIDTQLADGNIIKERAELEREKAKKQAEESIAQYRQQIVSEAHDRASKIEHKIVSEKEYDLLIQDNDFTNSLVKAIRFYEDRIKIRVSVGTDILLYETVLADRQEYPIIPLHYIYNGTPYTLGAIGMMIGKQEEINKAHQIMIHNANLSSNLRWLYYEGSIDEDQWDDDSTTPGARLKVRQGFDFPKEVMPLPLNNAFFSVTSEGKHDIEYQAGIPSSMMGIAKDAPDTYRGMLANDEHGTRNIRSWVNTVLNPTLTHVGKVFKEISQSVYQIDKVFRIVQPEAGNEPRERRINIPIYNDYGEAIGKWNDYATMQFDVRIIAGTTMPLNRWALVDEYFRWYQAQLIDDIAMLAETDIKGKEAIIERKSMYAQMQKRIKELEDALKNKTGDIETLSRQLIQSGIRHKVDTGEKEIHKAVTETKAAQKILQSKIKEKGLTVNQKST